MAELKNNHTSEKERLNQQIQAEKQRSAREKAILEEQLALLQADFDKFKE